MPRAERAAAHLRLATSGSAALPVSLAEWWQGARVVRAPAPLPVAEVERV